VLVDGPSTSGEHGRWRIDQVTSARHAGQERRKSDKCPPGHIVLGVGHALHQKGSETFVALLEQFIVGLP
jgi:hypothetical protein